MGAGASTIKHSEVFQKLMDAWRRISHWHWKKKVAESGIDQAIARKDPAALIGHIEDAEKAHTELKKAANEAAQHSASISSLYTFSSRA